MKTKLIFGLLIFGMIFLIWIILASALTPEEELTQLEQELTDAGFEWLINYSVDYPEVEVYEKDKDVLIALFESIKTEGWYQIFFDGSSGVGLGEGEEQDAFDLRVVGGYIEEIPDEILLKKRRIDRVKDELNLKGGINS